MNKLFSKIASLSVGLAMAAGVGLALGQQRVERVSAAASYDFTGDTLTFGDQGLSNGVQYSGVFTNDQFNVSFTGGGNDGKYYTDGSAVRTYGGGSINVSPVAGYKITAATLTFTGTNYAPNNVSVLSGDGTLVVTAAPTITWSGDSTSGFTLTRPSGSGHWRLRSVKVTASESTAPVVSIEDAPSSLEIGNKGTFVASSKNATYPTYTWSSDNADVLTVSSAGSYEAKAYGVANVTVNMTCDEGNASKSAKVIVNAGLITIAKAKEIIDGLASGKTTEFSVTVEGFVTSLNADNQTKPRALNLSAGKVGSEGNTLMIFGIYSDNAMREYIILNGTARFTGKLQNYTKDSVTTYEMTSPSLVSYSDDAEEYAENAYDYLNEACATGPSAITNDQWTGLADDFDALDEYAQAKLAGASASYPRENVAKWIDRYARIVNAGRDNFMGNTEISVLYNPGLAQQNIGYVIVISIIAVSAITFGLFFMFRKRKEK